MSETGLSLEQSQVISSREAIVEAVACGLGVGVVRKLETGKNPRLARLKIDCESASDNMLLTTEYVVCLKKRKNAAVIRAFRHAAQSA